MPANYKKGRVKFEYETEVNGANKTVELPMRMIVTGDWAKGMSDEAKKDFEKRGAYELEPGKTDDLIEKMGIELKLDVEDHIHEGGQAQVKLPIRGMKDFTPDQIVQAVPDLKELMALREKLQDIRDKTKGPKTYRKLLEKLGEESR